MPINTYPSMTQALPPGVSGFAGQQGISPIVGTIIGGGVSALVNRYLGTSSTASNLSSPYDTQMPSREASQEVDRFGRVKRRRRRRRLLTCSDKADIAFLHGQLGGGALGRAAISSLLSRRCG